MIDITYDMNRTECYLLLAHQVARRALVVMLCATGWQIISRDPVECRRIFAGFGQDGWTRGSFSLDDDIAAPVGALAVTLGERLLAACPSAGPVRSAHRFIPEVVSGFESDLLAGLSEHEARIHRGLQVDAFLAALPVATP